MHIQTKLNKERAAKNREIRTQEILGQKVEEICTRVWEESEKRWDAILSDIRAAKVSN